MIGRPFLITALGLALVLIWNSLTCLQIPLVKSSLPTGRVSSGISASENLVYCLLSSGKKHTEVRFPDILFDWIPKTILWYSQGASLYRQKLEWGLCQKHLSTSKSLISSNRFLIPLFILYWYSLSCCIFIINSYSTHIKISVDDTDRNENENKSYINFSEMDHGNDPGILFWQITYLLHKESMTDVTSTGFRILFRGKWLIEIEKTGIRSWIVKWIRNWSKRGSNRLCWKCLGIGGFPVQFFTV